MRRREFLGVLGGAAAWPLRAWAQDSRTKLLGILSGTADSPLFRTWIKIVQDELAKLGWTEGSNLQLDVRFASGDVELLKSEAARMAALRPDVILSHATPATLALAQTARSVPNVFVAPADPVASGFVESIARPGKNSTGFINFELTVGGKWIELLREINPKIVRVHLLLNPKTYPGGSGGAHVQFIRDAAAAFGIASAEAPFSSISELQEVFKRISNDSAAAVIVMPDTSTTLNADVIARLASQHRVLAVYPYGFFAKAGGLVSYGTDIGDLYRRSASYVDRILRGESAATLPVQSPTKYELFVNMKAARVLGVEIPFFLQQRADEVIE
jgi:putative ABC transport system substrate-binding protein